MAQTLFILIVCFITGGYLIERILEFLNDKHWSAKLPNELKDIYDTDKYERSQQYDKVKRKISAWSSSFNMTLIILMLFFDGFAILDQWASSIADRAVWQGMLFFGVLYFASDILNLPFALYGTFVIEERFGFNKITPKLFVADKLKGYMLAILIGGGVLALIILLYQQTGDLFWLYAWVSITAITLFFTMFYTSLIVPIFNKLTALKEGSLKEAIESYCKKTSFPLKQVYVMDGSKRSTKANAYFSGIGTRKSIVLFDTMIKDYSTEELVAVIAHETGHYKKRHIIKGFIISSMQMGILLFILNWLLDNPVLAEALGASEAKFHLGILAFALLYSPVSTLIGILMNMYSRKNEFEADQYAKTTAEGSDLASALKKLSVNNLSNLNPHPVYVFFHYSHPPLLQRLKAIEG